jgi:calcineurin-like phosphoesterase family protein
MGDRWIVSDTHFGHENSCVKFKLAEMGYTE